MSSGQGFAKLVNSPYTRIQPDLCSRCKFFEVHPEAGEWAQQCGAKHKILSNAHAVKGRCKEFEDSGEQRVSDEMLGWWKQDAQDHQDYLQRRKGRKLISP